MNNPTSVEPFVPANKSLPELTFRVFILGSLLTALLGASNVYLGLKLGTTIAASIPAAVISMSILRFFKNYNVLENNIVQTMASAGEGVAAAVAYVLPGLVIIGYWQHFDYFTIMCLVTVGGTLGVLISVPLRRVMLTHLKLPFPEGTAVGQVLKSSASGKTNIKPLWQGGLFGATISLLQTGFQVCADNLQVWFVTAKSSIHGCGFGFSPAMIAAGYIIGPATSFALFAGVVIGWMVGLPVLAHMYGLPTADSAYGVAVDLWKHHLRFIGVGTMLLGGFWTLATLLKPIYQGISLSMRSLKQMRNNSGQTGIPRTERDIPMHYLLWGSVLLLGIVFLVFFYVMKSTPLATSPATHFTISIVGALFVLVGGLLVASVAAYTSGLIGMTNTPLSGLVLVAVLLLSSLLLLFCKTHIHLDAGHTMAAVAIVLLITAVVSVIASISGENMQDLKAGQIVGATPWKQQVVLFAGVFIAALVVGPTLELLYQAYGMGGTFPRPGMNPSQMLPAPQASLIATVTQGVFGNSLSWQDINMGMGVALICIVVDKWLKLAKAGRLPVLAVGLSIYLPPEVMLPIIMGGVIHWLAHRKLTRDNTPKLTIRERMETGNLLACGLVAGSALIGVLLAIPFVIKGSSDALKLVSNGFQHYAEGLGVIVTLGLCVWIYQTAIAVVKE
jgi:putative OPT family oligopeptide transporter